MVAFTITSTQNFTVPTGCISLDSIAATGGGANGGSGDPFGTGGPGGGSGAYAVSSNMAVTPGESLTIFVGGVSGSSGIFSNTRGFWLCLAGGGSGQSGGSVGAANAVAINGNPGASGGGGSFVGGNGGNGGGSPAYGGGGAGAIGNTGNGPAGGNATNYGGGGGGGGGIGGGGSAPGPGGAGFQGIVTFSYTPVFPPTVTAVSPTVGQANGGLTVSIFGTNFDQGVSQVYFGGVPATSFVAQNTNLITAVTPSHALGTVDVQVTNVYGTSPVNAADHFTFNVTAWADGARYGPAPSLTAAVGVLRKASAALAGSTSVVAAVSSPQLFISTGLSPATLIAVTFNQPKGLSVGFAVNAVLGAYVGGAKQININLAPALSSVSRLNHKALLKTGLQIGAGLVPFLSLKQIQHNFALMTASAVLPPPYIDRLGLIAINWSINSKTAFDIQLVKFISSTMSPQVGMLPDITLESYQWNSYGSQLLYAASSGLEKAMIDADAPRLTGVDAEAIIDSWDPYACPLPLLPYLAWEMGVTFWNDKWSEETKRSWVAQQWQFKALRGTDAGITMAVDFAGRDVSPYGYFVRDFITAPQGLYPSPGITPAAQEAWLASLPQVREYLFQDTGLALADEFYIKHSFIGTDTWDGQSFITPNTAKSRLGKKATWAVDGVDVANVDVLDFGNYFQLQMPGTASVDEFYLDQSWLGTDDNLFDGTAFCTPNEAWKQLVTISPLTAAPYRIAVGPQYQAVEAQAELVTVPGVAGYDVFCGSNLFPHDSGGVFMSPAVTPNMNQPLRDPQTMPVFPSFFVPSTSDLRIFYRYAVYDPDDLPTGGTQGTMFCGVGFFDFPPFTAEVDVFMAGTRCSQEFAVDNFISPLSVFMIPQDNAPIAYVAGAIEAARGITQLTLLQPKPKPVFSAGAPFICDVDHYFVGQPQLST